MLLAKSLIITLMASAFLCSCSNDMENDVEQTGYRESAAEIGHEAAQTIKVPMENTQDAVDRENERMREYEKQLNE